MSYTASLMIFCAAPPPDTDWPVSLSWLHLLQQTAFVLTGVADIVGLVFVWPAYKRTRHRGFLALAAAFLLGLFEMVHDHFVDRAHMSFAQYLPYQTLHRLAYFAYIILLVGGVVALTRSYVAASAHRDDKPIV